MATELANNARLALALGKINFTTDSFIAILMDTGFSFDEDNDEGYADVSAEELATGFGYTQNTKALAGVTAVVNAATDRCEVKWNNVTWTAAGGNIGPSPGMIIYDDTVAAGDGVSADVIIGFIDFGSELTQVDGGTLSVINIQVDI